MKAKAVYNVSLCSQSFRSLLGSRYFVPHVSKIGKSLSVVLSGSEVLFNGDRIAIIRVTLHPSLARSLHVSLLYQPFMVEKNFFIGLPNHYFVFGRLG